MEIKHVLFVDEINKEFSKLVSMIKACENRKASYVDKVEKLYKEFDLPFAKTYLEQIVREYELSDAYKRELEEISTQRQKMVDWLISNGVDEEIACTMLFPF